MPVEITSLRNPIVQAAKRLQRSAERKTQGRFLVEGTHLFQEAVATQWPIEAVFCTSAWQAKHPSLVESRLTHTVTEQVLASIATTETPDGVVAIACQKAASPFPTTDFQLGIIAEHLQNPDNLGSLIRSSAAAAANGLWLIEPSVDPTNPKAIRSSAGQWFRLPPRNIPSIAAFRESLPNTSIQILGAAAGGKSYWEIDFTRPTVFVLGNEGAGLSPAAKASVDDCVSIPMAPSIESLNVAVAGALLLFEANRQRFAKLRTVSDF